MLQYEVATLEGLDAGYVPHYEKVGDKFRLKIEGLEIPDVSGLKTKVEELLNEKKAEQKKAAEAAEAARLAAEEAARKGGDVAALEKSWKEKLAKRDLEHQEETKGLRGIIDRKTVQATASDLAASLAVEGSAKTLLPHIQTRLRTEFRDGEAVVVVLDAAGKPSAMTVQELGQEIASDPAFAPIIVASKATGGGAKGDNGRGGAAVQKTVTRTKFDAMSQHERATFAKSGGKVVND